MGIRIFIELGPSLTGSIRYATSPCMPCSQDSPGTPPLESVGSMQLEGLKVMLMNAYSSLARLVLYADVGKFPFSRFLTASR